MSTRRVGGQRRLYGGKPTNSNTRFSAARVVSLFSGAVNACRMNSTVLGGFWEKR